MKAEHLEARTYVKLNHLLNSKPKGIPLVLHKYIWGISTIFILFLASFAIAYFRVAQDEKFNRQPFKSISWSENQKDNLAYPDKK